ncbi:MAG: YdcF family protein [Anaerolineales bacterium]|nr:YdcF family protein [Anaerolineales bacterium]
MFVVLSKLLPPLVYPLGLACLLILLALFLRKRTRTQRAILILALLLLWAGSTRWVAWGLTRNLELRYLPPAQFPKVEAMVVLGGGTLSGSAPRPMVEVNGAGDRILYAYKLFQDGKADHILLSGGSITWLASDQQPASDMAALLEMLGVSSEALWLEPASLNTYENAVNSRALLEARGIRRVILVTSALHMPRSVALFEEQGLEVIPAPADFIVTNQGWEQLTELDLTAQLYNLLPNAENLALTTRALKEHLGVIVYRLRGWL